MEYIWVFLHTFIIIIKKDILVLGIGPTQGLEHTVTAGKMYSINFTVTKNKFCLILHYNRANSYLFVNGTEIYKFKKILKFHYVWKIFQKTGQQIIWKK